MFSCFVDSFKTFHDMLMMLVTVSRRTLESVFHCHDSVIAVSRAMQALPVSKTVL